MTFEYENLPSVPSDMTVSWLESTLGLDIKAVESRREIYGTGTKLFYTITYADDHATDKAEERPTHVCIKGVFDPEMVRAQPWTVMLAQREAEFYHKMAPQVKHMGYPKCWWSGVSDKQGIVIMSDLNAEGCTFIPMTDTWPLEKVLEGVERLAGLHAQYWGAKVEDHPCKYPSSPLGIPTTPDYKLPSLVCSRHSHWNLSQTQSTSTTPRSSSSAPRGTPSPSTPTAPPRSPPRSSACSTARASTPRTTSTSPRATRGSAPSCTATRTSATRTSRRRGGRRTGWTGRPCTSARASTMCRTSSAARWPWRTAGRTTCAFCGITSTHCTGWGDPGSPSRTRRSWSSSGGRSSRIVSGSSVRTGCNLRRAWMRCARGPWRPGRTGR